MTEFSARLLTKWVSLFLAPSLGMQVCCSSIWSGWVVCAAISIHLESSVSINYAFIWGSRYWSHEKCSQVNYIVIPAVITAILLNRSIKEKNWCPNLLLHHVPWDRPECKTSVDMGRSVGCAKEGPHVVPSSSTLVTQIAALVIDAWSLWHCFSCRLNPGRSAALGHWMCSLCCA